MKLLAPLLFAICDTVRTEVIHLLVSFQLLAFSTISSVQISNILSRGQLFQKTSLKTWPRVSNAVEVPGGLLWEFGSSELRAQSLAFMKL
jgi:hypothetical protein